MGQITLPSKVKLIAGLLFVDFEILEETYNALINSFGLIDTKSKIIDFNFTNYYNKEMGENIKRQYISFEKLINPDQIVDIKIATNDLEEKISCSNLNRKINIDPGYIELGKLVLATTKNYTHRIYLTKGIYAETTLKFSGKTFSSWSFTYPDYKTQETIDYFNKVRELYKCQLQNLE